MSTDSSPHEHVLTDARIAGLIADTEADAPSDVLEAKLQDVVAGQYQKAGNVGAYTGWLLGQLGDDPLELLIEDDDENLHLIRLTPLGSSGAYPPRLDEWILLLNMRAVSDDDALHGAANEYYEDDENGEIEDGEDDEGESPAAFGRAGIYTGRAVTYNSRGGQWTQVDTTPADDAPPPRLPDTPTFSISDAPSDCSCEEHPCPTCECSGGT